MKDFLSGMLVVVGAIFLTDFFLHYKKTPEPDETPRPLNLQIVSRNRTEWIGTDSLGQEYKIQIDGVSRVKITPQW